jgi:opacity protein-like surface antigen
MARYLVFGAGLAFLFSCSLSAAEETGDIQFQQLREFKLMASDADNTDYMLCSLCNDCTNGPVCCAVDESSCCDDVAHGCRSCDCGTRVGCCSPYRRQPSMYASVNLAGLFTHLQSGGFNTVGFFPNTGDDNLDGFDIGGAIGLNIPRNWGILRIEGQFMARDMFDTITNSYRPPTPTFFYNVDIDDRWSAMANFWFDIPITKRVDIYLGGGVGSAGGSLSANDFVTQGAGRFTEGVWQVGGGVALRRGKRLTFDLGYRYIDYGTAGTNLTWFRGRPAGNYTMNLTSHQIALSVRFNSLGDFLPRLAGR